MMNYYYIIKVAKVVKECKWIKFENLLPHQEMFAYIQTFCNGRRVAITSLLSVMITLAQASSVLPVIIKNDQ